MATERPKLKGAFHLSDNFAVYVPSTTKKSKKIAPSTMRSRIDKVRAWMSKKYGGTTSVRGVGTYIDDDSKIIKENVAIVESFASHSDFIKHEEILYSTIKQWGRTWGQESMGFEFEGDMYYIDTRK